jgi:hypothetical protein
LAWYNWANFLNLYKYFSSLDFDIVPLSVLV